MSDITNYREQIENELRACRAWAEEHKITIERLKVCTWASEETYCFTAKIAMRGIIIGDANNDGRGGATDYHLPGLPADMKAPQGFDMLVDEMVDEIESAKRDERFITRAKKTAQKNGLNVAIIKKGRELAYQQTKESTLEDYLTKNPQPKGAQVTFCVFRNNDTILAAAIARTQKWADKLLRQGRDTGRNVVFGFNHDRPEIGWLTSSKTIEDFLRRNPDANTKAKRFELHLTNTLIQGEPPKGGEGL